MDKEACSISVGDWDTKRLKMADYIVFGATLLVSLGIGVFYGFFARNRQNTTAEFLMGSKKMNAYTLGISLSVG
jgi:Na+/proline symporter